MYLTVREVLNELYESVVKKFCVVAQRHLNLVHEAPSIHEMTHIALIIPENTEVDDAKYNIFR